MLQIKQYNSELELNSELSRNEVINFLHTHLDQFRDTKEAINKCIDYAFSKQEGKGGFIIAGFFDNKLASIVIMNRTGMEVFIPENILVYIAVDSSLRGKGIGTQIMNDVIFRSQGNIKLHVEYDNPAKRLYERIGFTTKYAEMRYEKNKQ